MEKGALNTYMKAIAADKAKPVNRKPKVSIPGIVKAGNGKQKLYKTKG